MYNRILVPIDGSRTSATGLKEAIKLAADSPGATIRLLHVLDQLPALQGMEMAISSQVLDNLEQFGDKLLKKSRAEVQRHGVKVETVFSRKAGRTADAIVAEAKKWKAHVIVMGTHGRGGIGRVVMGSDAEAVVRTAPVPVLLVRSGK